MGKAQSVVLRQFERQIVEMGAVDIASLNDGRQLVQQRPQIVRYVGDGAI